MATRFGKFVLCGFEINAACYLFIFIYLFTKYFNRMTLIDNQFFQCAIDDIVEDLSWLHDGTKGGTFHSKDISITSPENKSSFLSTDSSSPNRTIGMSNTALTLQFLWPFYHVYAWMGN